jgi:hypothetical protein
MATASIVRAAQLKFAGLTAASFPGGVLPALYFDEAPVVTGSGAQAQVTTQGYVVLKHTGTRARAYAFGGATREDVGLEFEVYYPTLGDALTAVGVIKAGFDYGTLPDLDTAVFLLLAIRPVSDRPAFAGLGKTGANVHQWTVGYSLELVRGA